MKCILILKLISLLLFGILFIISCDSNSTKPSPPELSLSTNSLDFGNDINELQVEIKNTGEDNLSWTASSDEKWMICSPDSGINTLVMTVGVERDSFETSGEKYGKILINSNGVMIH